MRALRFVAPVADARSGCGHVSSSSASRRRPSRPLARQRAQGHAVVLAGRCHARESVPFKGLDALIDDLSRYLRKLDPLHLAGLIPRDVSALRRLFPVLGRIEAIAQAPERPVRGAFELRRRARLALGELLGRIRDRQPLVVALGELQWCDANSAALLRSLLRHRNAPRLLLVASHRAETGVAGPILARLYRALESDGRVDVRHILISSRFWHLGDWAGRCGASKKRPEYGGRRRAGI